MRKKDGRRGQRRCFESGRKQKTEAGAGRNGNGVPIFKGKEPCSFYHRRRRKNDAAVRDGRLLCKNDQKVLVTTSTHIYRPPKEWHDQSLEAVERKFRTGRAAIIGSACRDPEKLSMPETELFEEARKRPI